MQVPEMSRNLIFNFLLNRAITKVMFGPGKLILIRSEDFISQGYAWNPSLFVLDAMWKVANNVENVSSSTYIAESLEMCHGKIGHLNVVFIKQVKQIY